MKYNSLGIIFIFSVIFLNCNDSKSNVSTDQSKNEYTSEEIPLTKFHNKNWISTIDSLYTVTVENDKWTNHYVGEETSASDVYNIRVSKEYLKNSESPNDFIDVLFLENEFDTMYYHILGNSNDFLSLQYMSRGNLLTFKALK